jgi:hypothetical protein
MTRLHDQLEQARADIEKVLKPRKVGTSDYPRTVQLVDLAVERMAAWSETHPPASSVGAERGGSSSPREVEDRQEARRLANQVARDLNRFPELIGLIESSCALAKGRGSVVHRLEQVRAHCGHGILVLRSSPASWEKLWWFHNVGGTDVWTRDLTRLVARYTETVHEDKLPSDVPGCRSCARVEWDDGVKQGGHFAPVMPWKGELVDGKVVRGNAVAAAAGLCRWCFTWAQPEAVRLKCRVEQQKSWPPVKACDLRHAQSERAAGVYLAKVLAERERAA